VGVVERKRKSKLGRGPRDPSSGPEPKRSVRTTGEPGLKVWGKRENGPFGPNGTRKRG